jgi:positive regulator of sigma E activity
MRGIINTIEVRGTVCSRSAGKIWVLPSRDCSDESSCGNGCASCAGKPPERTIVVDTTESERCPQGTGVIVQRYVLNEAAGAMLVFGIPLLCAMTVLAVRYCTDPSTVESGMSLLAAGGAFIGGFAIVGLIDRIFRKRFPATVRISPALQSDPAAIPGAPRHG